MVQQVKAILQVKVVSASDAHSYCQNTAWVTQTHLRHWSRVSAALSVECEFSCEGEALLQTHMVRKWKGRNKTGAMAKSEAPGTTSNKPVFKLQCFLSPVESSFELLKN